MLNGDPTTRVEMGLMRAGDCNGDNVVNAEDFGVQRNTFGKAVGHGGYDDKGDMTGEGVANTVDFNLLKGNFGDGGTPIR